MKRVVHPVASAVVAAVALSSCGSGGASSGCSAPVREALDPQSGVHLLDTASLSYLTDPPTSGPHVAAPLPVGAQSEPLPRPLQVAVLESGGVMIQYGDDATSADIAALETLVEDGVVVAPLMDNGPTAVATAWLYKQECSSVDVDALQQFVDDHLGATEGH